MTKVVLPGFLFKLGFRRSAGQIRFAQALPACNFFRLVPKGPTKFQKLSTQCPFWLQAPTCGGAAASLRSQPSRINLYLPSRVVDYNRKMTVAAYRCFGFPEESPLSSVGVKDNVRCLEIVQMISRFFDG